MAELDEVHIEGEVFLPVGGQILAVQYVTWKDRCWLAPVQLQSPNGEIRPLRLIAPRFAPGITPSPGPDMLNIFQKMPLSGSVLEQGFIPPDLAPLVEIVENPNVRIIGV